MPERRMERRIHHLEALWQVRARINQKVRYRSAQGADKAIKAVRMLTSLDSGPVLAASAQLLAAEGGDGATEVEE
jgi:hypothetical protein